MCVIVAYRVRKMTFFFFMPQLKLLRFVVVAVAAVKGDPRRRRLIRLLLFCRVLQLRTMRPDENSKRCQNFAYNLWRIAAAHRQQL